MTNTVAIPPEVINSLPASWQVYAGALSSIFVAVAAIGRAYHAWKNDSGVLKALLFGTNTPSNGNGGTAQPPAPKPTGP